MRDKRNEILKAASNLFIHYGYRKTTLDDLAEATGLKKSTLYHYFSGKEEIFREMAEYIYVSHIREIEDAVLNEPDISKAILACMECIENNIREFSPSLKVLMGEYDDIHDYVNDIFEKHALSVVELVSRRIDQAVKDGQLNDTINSRIFSEVLLNFYSMVFKHSRFSNIYRNIAENREEYLAVLLKPYFRQ